MNTPKLIAALAALFLAVPVVAFGASYLTQRGDTLQSIASSHGITVAQLAQSNPSLLVKSGQNVTFPVQTPTPIPPVVTPPTGNTAQEIRLQAYTTGYGWPDNTPKGSADISSPVMHSFAGGTGTASDPITLAVGHVILGGRDVLDYRAGTVFYIPNLRKYFIVEDSCGDGQTPQNGPCHTGYQGHPWLDLWVGGNAGNQSATLACEDAITDVHLVIQNPASNYAVVAGEVANGCKQYGDTVVTQ